MDIDLEGLSAGAVYQHLVQTVIPRPVAWVLSENRNGSYNLAPFSYFNAVCSDPPLVLLSIGRKPDGTPKDTRANIEQRRHFVVHIAHRELVDVVNASSATLPADVSEVERLGLVTVSWPGSALPRLADCRIALACRLFDIRELGPEGQALILGRVQRVYWDDAVCIRDAQGRLKVDVARADPLARLGIDEYLFTGEVHRLRRPP